ncbi:DUF6279 family lipoprotein [Parendozoicomonas haliclonae]|uniref:Lipoprotein n=1 Tax=Parendozoicomonas haliclonae TaxID=1960125 RepID=A0A1X7AGV7_9GAMM|nr:DUF6279 family lipoprotein [Parendozoicomonas haliclonae]SMA41422.1 hypothetical protein EHSB41UT_01246 [Parendozoicomonas haliclonae]
MPTHLPKGSLRALLFSLTLIVIAGCTGRLLYNNIDWILLKAIDDFITLNEQQEKLITKRIQPLKVWIENNEVPAYENLLQQLLSLNKESLTIDTLSELQNQIQERYNSILSRLSPDLIAISQTLTEEQKQEFLERLTERHQERDKEYANKSERQIRSQLCDRTEESVTDWIGSINREQQIIVKHFCEGMQLTTKEWQEYRQRLREQTQALLTIPPASTDFEKQLNVLLMERETLYSPALKKKNSHNRELAMTAIVELGQTLSEDQWQHFYRRIEKWQKLLADFRQH